MKITYIHNRPTTYYKIVLKSKGMLIGLDDFYFWAPDWFMN